MWLIFFTSLAWYECGVSERKSQRDYEYVWGIDGRSLHFDC